MALYYPPTINGLQKTLSAQLDEGVTSGATLDNTTNIQNLKGIMLIDRIDTAGKELDEAKREYVGFAGTSGSTVVTLTRGLGGTTDQDHAVGAVVEFVSDVVQQQAILDALTNVVTATGVLDTTKVVDLSATQTLTNKTLTQPKIGTSINDTNGNELVKVTTTASAVNELTLANAATGASPTISATGGDTNIDIILTPKGTGRVKGPMGKRVTTATDATSITPNTDNCDITYQANTQATGTLTINADGGTPTNGQFWELWVKCTNAQTASFNAQYVGTMYPFPTSFPAGKNVKVLFQYDSGPSKWGCLTANTET